MDTDSRIPICPICEQTMTLANAVKGFFPSPEARVFKCVQCAVIETRREASALHDRSNASRVPLQSVA
jgi:hypothetical protein